MSGSIKGRAGAGAVRGFAIERGAFVGRAREKSEILELLAAPASLVTLWGPGGAGKTRTALAVARELEASDYRAAFCELGAIETTADVVAAIARTIGLELDTTEGNEARARLGHALAVRVDVLIIDNVESAAVLVAEVVGDLLSARRSVQVIATSREIRSPTRAIDGSGDSSSCCSR